MSEFAPRSLALARLHAARADLMASLIGLDTERLAHAPLNDDGWTVRDTLAHLAQWDAFEAGRLAMIRDGQLQSIKAVDVNAQNAAWLAQFKAISLDTALAMCLKERNSLLNVIALAQPEQVETPITLPFGRIVSIVSIIDRQAEHDAMHAATIAAWRDLNGLTERQRGPRSVLVAALRATRRALRATVEVIPPAQRSTRIINGEWSAHALVAHLTGWEQYCIDGLREGAHPATADGVYGVDSFNALSIAQRADWSWDAVWSDYATAHATLVRRVESMSGPELAAAFHNDTSAHTYYSWIEGILRHTLHHSAELRASLGVSS